jgi:hypothetical protein
VLETIFCRSVTLSIQQDSEPTKLLHHPNLKHRRAGGLKQTNTKSFYRSIFVDNNIWHCFLSVPTVGLSSLRYIFFGWHWQSLLDIGHGEVYEDCGVLWLRACTVYTPRIYNIHTMVCESESAPTPSILPVSSRVYGLGGRGGEGGTPTQPSPTYCTGIPPTILFRKHPLFPYF